MKIIPDHLVERLVPHVRRWMMNRSRALHPRNHPRRWSNDELKKLAPLFSGSVVNVSGWRDEDKDGGFYRDYFCHAESYSVTNYFGTDEANDGAPGSMFLDLQKPLPDEMHARFDIVFNHTVLEHVADVELACKNLCEMTRDVVITVVPFAQQEHYTESLYGDYWRITPMGIERLMNMNGLEVLYLRGNDQWLYPMYLVVIASKQPDLWAEKIVNPWKRQSRLGHDLFFLQGDVW